MNHTVLHLGSLLGGIAGCTALAAMVFARWALGHSRITLQAIPVRIRADRLRS